MKCPCCGYDMRTANRCLRCGYTDHSVATVDENTNKNEDEPSVKVIDPSQVVLVETPIEEDERSYFDPISSLFDSFFGDPISDILNMFGFGSRGSSRRAQGRPAQNEKPRRNIKMVELDDVEVLDANDNTIYSSKKDKNKHDRK